MTRIIDIRKVAYSSGREYEKYRKLYASFFRHECVRSNSTKPEWRCKIQMFLGANRYVHEMTNRIKARYRYGYVAYDDITNKPCGLIVGYDDPQTGITNICHLYAVPTPQNNLHLSILNELLSTYLKQAKANGMTKAQTTSDLTQERFIGDLENLGFLEESIDGTEIEYGKTI